jgi:hypothetical protein
MPGPASVALTFAAAASEAARDGAMGVVDVEVVVRTNLTGIVEPVFDRMLFGSGEMNPPNP